MSWIRVAALLGFLGVLLGAFGAHGLKQRVTPELLAIFNTGVLYHLLHAVALLSLALYGKTTEKSVTWPAALWLAGIVLFSGSLYVLTLTGVKQLGAVTPLGGLCFLAGWVMLAIRLR
jgi:uncharacterized membrane protein YgdD (TMEM256/DUF423 family)